MPVLVRWQQADGTAATVRCSSAHPHPVLPSHLQLVGVRGANDPEHADLQVVSLSIRYDDILYMCDCVPAAAAQAPAPQQQSDEEKSEPKTESQPRTRRVRKRPQ